MKVVFTPGLYSGNKKIDEQHITVFKKADQMITAIETGTSKEELLQQHAVEEDEKKKEEIEIKLRVLQSKLHPRL